MAGLNGSYTLTTPGTYATKPFRYFLSNGLAKVSQLKATGADPSQTSDTSRVVTTEVIDSASNVLPSGHIYSIGDDRMFTSITTTDGCVTLYF